MYRLWWFDCDANFTTNLIVVINLFLIIINSTLKTGFKLNNNLISDHLSKIINVNNQLSSLKWIKKKFQQSDDDDEIIIFLSKLHDDVDCVYHFDTIIIRQHLLINPYHYHLKCVGQVNSSSLNCCYCW